MHQPPPPLVRPSLDPRALLTDRGELSSQPQQFDAETRAQQRQEGDRDSKNRRRAQPHKRSETRAKRKKLALNTVISGGLTPRLSGGPRGAFYRANLEQLSGGLDSRAALIGGEIVTFEATTLLTGKIPLNVILDQFFFQGLDLLKQTWVA